MSVDLGPDRVEPVGLADDLTALYERTRARMGDADLEHIRTVAAYSQAIKKRSRELITGGAGATDFTRGIALYALHTLLEFSELGHNILHGSYDHLPHCGEFHSEVWRWDFNADPHEWKVMHHRNHHPFTNIVGKDHDLGYSIVRLQPGQDWFAHHLVQLAVIAPVLIPAMSYYMGFYTAMSAAATEGRKVLRPATFRAVGRIVADHVRRDYLADPRAAGLRAPRAAAGNYLGATLGHLAVFFLVALEHHAPNVEVFHDPGPDETPDEYYVRQIRGTTNFTRWEHFDHWLERVLADVDFPDRPDFRVFYGGLDTHLEHHLFPDLPPNRQREIADEVRALCARHGQPYNEYPIVKYVPLAFQKLGMLALPLGERENYNPIELLTGPIDTALRLGYGALFKAHPDTPYLVAPKFFDAQAKVLSARTEAGGQARWIRIAKPRGWDDVTWDAGAFVSVRVRVNGVDLVRQYSLIHDHRGSDFFEICVKRVADGRVSNHLNDAVRTGGRITLVGPPTSEGAFVMTRVPERALFIAGGVGITPIVAMLRKMVREAPAADAVLLYFNRDERSIIFDRQLRRLARSSGVRIVHVVDTLRRPRPGLEQGRISADLIARHVPDIAERQVYTCAPAVVIDLARTFCTELGVPAERFHTESFTPPALERPAVGADERYWVRFRRSDTEIEVDGCTTLLEAARAAGVAVPTGCERGLCRACVTGKLRGTVHDEPSGVAQARVTVCTSLPRSDIELDL